MGNLLKIYKQADDEAVLYQSCDSTSLGTFPQTQPAQETLLNKKQQSKENQHVIDALQKKTKEKKRSRRSLTTIVTFDENETYETHQLKQTALKTLISNKHQLEENQQIITSQENEIEIKENTIKEQELTIELLRENIEDRERRIEKVEHELETLRDINEKTKTLSLHPKQINQMMIMQNSMMAALMQQVQEQKICNQHLEEKQQQLTVGMRRIRSDILEAGKQLSIQIATGGQMITDEVHREGKEVRKSLALDVGDASKADLDFKHPLIRKHQKTLEERLHVTQELLDKLYSNGVISNDVRINVDKQSSELGKVKYLLYCVDQALCEDAKLEEKFITTMQNCSGINGKLANMLTQ